MSIIQFLDRDAEGSTLNGHQERLTPQSLEAEQSAVGAMLISPVAVDAVLSIAQRNDFYRSNHRFIIDAITGLRADGEPVDIVTIATRLREQGNFDDAGGMAYLSVLIEACPTAGNAKAYAEIVREQSVKRKLISAADLAADATYKNDSAALGVALRLLSEAQADAASSGERFKFHSLKDLRARPPVTWMVEGLLLERTLSVLFGAGATYKSFMALDIGLHLASGRPWHGAEVLAGPVIYCAGEGIDGISARADAWLNRYQVDDVPDFIVIDGVPKLCDAEDVARLVARAKGVGVKPRFIIIDTLAWAMEGADENNTGDMGRAVAAAKRLRDELGAAVMIVHHTNKSGELRGNLALRNNVDAMIDVRADDRMITLTCNKQKDRPPFEPKTFKGGVVEIEGGTSLVFEPCAAVPVGRQLTEKEAGVFGVLDAAMPTPMPLRDWAAACVSDKLPVATFYYIKDRLLKYGMVKDIGKVYVTVD